MKNNDKVTISLIVNKETAEALAVMSQMMKCDQGQIVTDALVGFFCDLHKNTPKKNPKNKTKHKN